MKLTVVSILFLFCLLSAARCQTIRHFQWFNAGLGLTTDKLHNSIWGFNSGLDYYYLIRKKSTVQFGLSNITNFVSLFGTNPTVSSIYFGYGKSIVSSHTILGIYLAPALDIGHTSEGINFVTGGINPTLQAVFHPIFNVGLALEIFGQFNPKQSAAGFRIMLHFNNTNRKLD